MKHSFYALVLIVLCIGLSACKKQEESKIILAEKPKAEQPRQTERVGDYENEIDVEWMDKTYKVFVSRTADENLPQGKEGNQNYYDNRLTLRITRPDGSVMFEKSFQKSDFNAFVPESFRKNSVLLGVAFDRTDDQAMYFMGSVGSPDPNSDEFIPVVLRINRSGQMSMSKAQQLDSTLPSDDEEP